ncbi:MAG: metallophosphoesterase family protein [Planctomycetaceae bacterium]
MLRAIISDIHGNLEALEAVLADIRSQGIETIYCLGDVIGYGPNPRECIDRVMQTCEICLLGNHDQGALFDPEGFNAGAERAIFWTRKMLESGDQKGNERRWEFLGELPRMKRESPFLFVHGSARNPLNEYVFPEDIYNQRKMERIFGLVEQYCFQGHTHIPGIFTEDLNFQSPEEVDFQYRLGAQKVLVNVGSVGQPRNGDHRSSYLVLHDEDLQRVQAAASNPVTDDTALDVMTGVLIEFRRVEYDYEKTIAKIYAVPELDNFLGDRLRDGR